jgi:ankyrin repeat protein
MHTIKVRARLAKLTGEMSVHAWDNLHTRMIAEQLQLAIEGVMNLLFPRSQDIQANFCWHLIITHSIGTDIKQEGFPLHVLKKPGLTWKADLPELEALVGLWAWSYRDREAAVTWKKNARLIALNPETDPDGPPSWDEIWIHERLGSLEIGLKEGWTGYNVRKTNDPRFFGCQAVQGTTGHSGVRALYVPTQNQITTMCAQDIFIAFLVASLKRVERVKKRLDERLRGTLDDTQRKSLEESLKCLLERSEGRTEIRTNVNHGRVFQLKNSTVEEMVDCFERSNLGSREDAYMCIIPTLRWATGRCGKNEGLHLAVNGNYKNEAQALVKNGADVNVRNTEGLSALHVAVIKRYKEVVKVLIENGADREARNREGWTVLHVAVDKSSGIAEMLIGDCADVDATNPGGWTALHLAAERGSKQIVKALCNKHADKNKRTNEGLSALRIAVGRGNEEVTRELLNSGVDPKADVQNGWTVLHLAADGGYSEVVQLFVDKGVDINAKNQDGCTALHLVAEQGNRDMVKVLLAKGADVKLEDKEGRTALHLAVLNGDQEVAQMLIRGGANVNARDKKGSTVLQLAVDGQHKQLEKKLVDHGAITIQRPQEDIREEPATQPTTRDHVNPATIRSSMTSMSTMTVPCVHIRIGDILILQGQPCQVIRITTSSRTGQYRYLGVDLFSKQLYEQSSFISSPAPVVIIQNMLGPIYKKYRGLEIRNDRVVAMAGNGDIKEDLRILDQSGLLERLTRVFDNRGETSVHLIVINSHGMEMILNYKLVYDML